MVLIYDTFHEYQVLINMQIGNKLKTAFRFTYSHQVVQADKLEAITATNFKFYFRLDNWIV